LQIFQLVELPQDFDLLVPTHWSHVIHSILGLDIGMLFQALWISLGIGSAELFFPSPITFFNAGAANSHFSA
jgi:hypothetical protein